MDDSKNAIKSKARMVVRTVFRGKRKRQSPMCTTQTSSIKLTKNNGKQDIFPNKIPLRILSKESGVSEKSKIKFLSKKHDDKRESLSADNILKGSKIDGNKLTSILNENDKLKKKIQNQNRQLEDLKHQLNSERSVYEGKIDYLNTISDSNTKNKNLKTVSVGTQTNAVDNYFISKMKSEDQMNFELEELKQQLYKQTLVTKCVCSKYIKLKTFKDDLTDKMIKTDHFYKMFVSDILQNFEECRISFALARAGSLDKGSIEQLLDKNARLAYNNAAMQIELFKIEKELKTAKSLPPVFNSDEDFDIIKAVKAKSNEYALTKRPSSLCGSNISRSNSIRTGWRPSNTEILSNSGDNTVEHQISVCGTVISVPVAVVNNGKVSYRMTPMFETVTDLQDSQQPVTITCDSNFNKLLEYNPELVSPSKNK